MRLGTVSGRASLITESGAIDVEKASQGQFGPDVTEIYEQWAQFADWASAVADSPDAASVPFDRSDLGSPSPAPRQVFAIGLNYRSHATEVAVEMPDLPAWPPTFTKFATSLTGPYTDLKLPSDRVDWEVELVVVIGVRGERITEEAAWSHVAGLTVGQDFSERDVQRAGPAPQFSLGKSFPGFGPTGPWLVTTDEVGDPDDLALECVINGVTVQKSRTSMMILSVPQLIARLSSVTPLLPGDLIFTGTPSGVGMGRKPESYLNPGDEVVSTITGIGTLRQMCVG
jgi:2-keto-4-pentenoate hydratase/2-oxohepta-3-ene-1,7-dioic acid hydratase in catechol pathway